MVRDTTLLVASTGGHLSELVQLAPRIEPCVDKRIWVTFDTQQSRSLLYGERVYFVRFMAPRQWWALLVNFARSLRILRRHRPARVVSTGAGVALSFLPLARFFGGEATYIESAARIEGPSATGRILACMPRVVTYTQNERWADDTWKFRYSVFDEFEAGTLRRRERTLRPHVFVQVGTLEFPFTRLVERVATHLPEGADVTWQLGATTPPIELPGRSFDFASPSEIENVIRSSTVVISHAGVGSALMTLNSGVRPVLVPRSGALREHVDDHQTEVALELAARGIAVHVAVDDIDSELLSRDFRLSPSGAGEVSDS